MLICSKPNPNVHEYLRTEFSWSILFQIFCHTLCVFIDMGRKGHGIGSFRNEAIFKLLLQMHLTF